ILEYKENVNEGDTQKRVKYKNGDIAEYGRHPKKGLIWRKYVALDEEIEIVRMLDEINYVKGNIIIKYQFSNTKRRYTGPAPFAGFIGALAEVGFELTTTGSCFYEASCFPSSEHVNGKSIDTLYKFNVVQDQKIINAMEKFHFTEILVGNPNTDKKTFKPYIPHYEKLITLGGQDGQDTHNHHMHFENFQYEIAEVYL
ncbi:hypothetical protein J3U63_13245, partial [Gilliamella sp. B2838]